MEILKIKETETGIVTLCLNRPERRNALNVELMDALANACERIAFRPEVRVVLLQGEGSVFCSGLDLVQANDPSLAEPCAHAVSRMLRSVYRLPQVSIAAVEGAAVAGGAGLMSACDLVIASEGARIGYPEVRRGLVAASVMALLRRQVRERDARELLLLGELIAARRALEMGLVSELVPPGQAQSRAMLRATQVLESAPGAVRRTKSLLDELWPSALDGELDQTLRAYLGARDTDEAREGIRSFLEKRKPRWAP